MHNHHWVFCAILVQNLVKANGAGIAVDDWCGSAGGERQQLIRYGEAEVESACRELRWFASSHLPLNVFVEVSAKSFATSRDPCQTWISSPTINCFAQTIAVASSSSVRSILAMTAFPFFRDCRSDIVAFGIPVRP
jgi:hypothetical protein